MLFQVACPAVLRRILRLPVLVLLWAALLTGMTAAARAELSLGPGDTVRLSIHGLPNSELQSTVGMDGALNFAWPGSVLATGKTLEAVTAEVRSLATGRVYKHYTNEGLLKIIQLDTNDISLDVVRYRPVFVTGDVARPGEVAFTPGISVRAAIAVSGGVRSSVLSGLAIADPAQIVRWQNEYDAASLDHATAVARLWRVDAEAASSADLAPPGAESVVIVASVLDALIAEQRQIVGIHLRSAEEDRKYLDSVLEQARNRVVILTEQQENQSALVASDEEEQGRVQGLVDRNLVPATRLEESRRTVVLSKSRLLELEAQLAQAALDVTRTEREIAAFGERRQTQLAELREQFTTAMIEAQLRMEMLSQNLAGADQGGGVAALLSRTDAAVVVYRAEGGQIRRIAMEQDDALLPGDTIEVQIEQPVGRRLGQ